MQVPYSEDLASHTGPESWVVTRKDSGQALTGEDAGWAIEPRKTFRLRSADDLPEYGRQYPVRRYARRTVGSARSMTPCTYRSSSHGSREIPRLATARWAVVRGRNPKGARCR